MSIERDEFLRQFMEWTDEDLEKLAEEADYTTFMGVFRLLAQEVGTKAKSLQGMKNGILGLEEELDIARGNLERLEELEGRHVQKRKKNQEEGKKLEQKMLECKAKWKKLQL